jgi:hypothetical protein
MKSRLNSIQVAEGSDPPRAECHEELMPVTPKKLNNF